MSTASPAIAMPRIPNAPGQFQLQLSGWKAIAFGLMFLAIVIAVLVLLTIGFFVIALPIMLLAPVFFYFMPRPKRFTQADPTETPANGGEIIDVDYQVLDETPVETDQPRIDRERP